MNTHFITLKASLLGSVALATSVRFDFLRDAGACERTDPFGGTKPTRRSIACCQAFTLVELLAVIVVIAVLAAFAIPASIASVNKARSVQCASNLRQLYILLSAYTADNNGCYPLPGRVPALGGRTSWDSDISPSKSITKLLRCPSDNIPLSWSGLRRTYSMNMKAMGSTAINPTDSQDGKSILVIQEPSKTILLVEWPAPNNAAYSDSCSCAGSPSAQLTYSHTPLHDKRFNYLFCDGHVEALAPADTIGTGTLGVPKGFWVLDSLGR